MKALGISAATLLIGALGTTSDLRAEGDAPGGKRWIAKLENPATATAALTELFVREGREASAGLERTTITYESPQVVACPLPGGSRMFLIFGESHNEFHAEDPDGYSDEHDDRLFARIPPSPVTIQGRDEPFLVSGRETKKVIFAFTEDGKEALPFDGDNLLSGVIVDLTGEGFIERADETRYDLGKGRRSCRVLEITRALAPKGRPLLSVLIDMGHEQWDWDVVTQDGKFVVRIGRSSQIEEESGFRHPAKDRLVSVVAEFRWNAEAGKFEGPAGGIAQHFLVLNNNREVWEQLKELTEVFPEDSPQVVREGEALQEPTPTPRVAVRWRYRSLKGLSDEQLFERMTGGRNPVEEERKAVVPTRLPERFWDLPAKEAALALVRDNLNTEAASRRYAIDDLDGVRPPDSGIADFEWTTGGCSAAHLTGRASVRIGRDGGEVEDAEVWLEGQASEHEISQALDKARMVFPVAANEVRWLYNMIWWLGRVRSEKEVDGEPALYDGSTADGQLKFRVAPDAQPWLETTLIGGPLSEMWMGNYTRKLHGNLALFALRQWMDRQPGRGDRACPTVGKPPELSTLDEFIYHGRPADRQDTVANEKWAERLLGILSDPKEANRHISVIGAFGDYQDTRIDTALAACVRKVTEKKWKGDEFAIACAAAEALALRGHSDVFPALLEILNVDAPEESGWKGGVIEVAANLVVANPDFSAPFEKFLSAQLASISTAPYSTSDLFAAAWLADCRGLAPQLHELATASEDEVESLRANTVGGEPHPEANEKFHDARRIVTAWAEEDPLTRAKLSALVDAKTYTLEPSHLLRRQYDALAPAERQRFLEFVRWLQAKNDGVRLNRLDRVEAQFPELKPPGGA